MWLDILHRMGGGSFPPTYLHPAVQIVIQVNTDLVADEVQRVRWNEEATGGTFTITANDPDGVPVTTGAIAWDATVAQAQAAFNAAFGSALIVVTDLTAEALTLTWTGAGMTGIDQDPVIADVDALDGVSDYEIEETVQGGPGTGYGVEGSVALGDAAGGFFPPVGFRAVEWRGELGPHSDPNWQDVHVGTNPVVTYCCAARGIGEQLVTAKRSTFEDAPAGWTGTEAWPNGDAKYLEQWAGTIQLNFDIDGGVGFRCGGVNCT
jgi:hypothetical protein